MALFCYSSSQLVYKSYKTETIKLYVDTLFRTKLVVEF